MSLSNWAGQTHSLGYCEQCQGTGLRVYATRDVRPPRVKDCGRCGATGIDPEGPLQGCVAESNGLLVSRTDGWDVFVVRMLVNHRVILSRTGDDTNIVAGFCFQGTSDLTLLQAVIAAKEWAKGDVIDSDPVGYIKVAFDGREHAYWDADRSHS